MSHNRMRIKATHHSAFATNQLEETILFWRDLLGFQLISTFAYDGERQYCFSIKDGPSIVFFEWPDSEPMPRKRHGEKREGPIGFDHLAFELETMEDLSAMQNLLVDQEVSVSNIIDHGSLYSVYTFDPNNIPLEFLVAKSSCDLNDKPMLKDPNPPSIVHQSPPPPEYDPDPEDERLIVPGQGSEFSENG